MGQFKVSIGFVLALGIAMAGCGARVPAGERGPAGGGGPRKVEWDLAGFGDVVGKVSPSVLSAVEREEVLQHLRAGKVHFVLQDYVVGERFAFPGRSPALRVMGLLTVRGDRSLEFDEPDEQSIRQWSIDAAGRQKEVEVVLTLRAGGGGGPGAGAGGNRIPLTIRATLSAAGAQSAGSPDGYHPVTSIPLN